MIRSSSGVRLNSVVRQLKMQLANAWKQSGRISIWRYTENERNYPGWNLDALAADGAGSRSIAITAPTKAQLAV